MKILPTTSADLVTARLDSHPPLQTAVLFLVFNRPDTTAQVFEAIRKARPPRLYVAADGARNQKIGEDILVERVRKIATQIDWDCELKTLFGASNSGCKLAVSSAISWFFLNEESGIIIEDDILPSLSFFYFCEQLLLKYKDDQSVGMISGTNYFFGEKVTDDDYYFSRFPYIWGWASWRRTWNTYSVTLDNCTESEISEVVNQTFQTKKCKEYFKNSIILAKNGKIDTWDYQFAFNLFNHKLFNICPTVNLISNIGFGVDATHTKEASKHNNMPRCDLDFPITHPVKIVWCNEADLKFEHSAFRYNLLKSIRTILSKVKNAIQNILRS
jgi:hypothetical protein